MTQVRNKDRLGELQALGANQVIDVTTEDVIARVKAITGALSKAGFLRSSHLVVVLHPYPRLGAELPRRPMAAALRWSLLAVPALAVTGALNRIQASNSGCMLNKCRRGNQGAARCS